MSVWRRFLVRCMALEDMWWLCRLFRPCFEGTWDWHNDAATQCRITAAGVKNVRLGAIMLTCTRDPTRQQAEAIQYPVVLYKDLPRCLCDTVYGVASLYICSEASDSLRFLSATCMSNLRYSVWMMIIVAVKLLKRIDFFSTRHQSLISVALVHTECSLPFYTWSYPSTADESQSQYTLTSCARWQILGRIPLVIRAEILDL